MTLFFNNATDDIDWNTLGNWWRDSECTLRALRLPENGDSVVILSTVGLSGPQPDAISLDWVICDGAQTQGFTAVLDRITANHFLFMNQVGVSGAMTGAFTYQSGSFPMAGNGHAGDVEVFAPCEYPFNGSTSGNLTYHNYVHGCTNQMATNYDSAAVIDDGSCEIPEP